MNSREKFDTLEKPLKTPAYLKPVMWILALANVIPVGGKIKKVNCEGLEPPFLLLQNHGSFVDFAMAEKQLCQKAAIGSSLSKNLMAGNGCCAISGEYIRESLPRI